MTGGKRREDTLPGEVKTLTVRFPEPIHYGLVQESERSGKSLNTLVLEACADALAPPGGASRIARLRRKVIPHRGQVNAALSFLLAYAGRMKEAERLWPDGWGTFPGKGTRDDLAAVGAWVAAEIDSPTMEARWATSARRSASGV